MMRNWPRTIVFLLATVPWAIGLGAVGGLLGPTLAPQPRPLQLQGAPPAPSPAPAPAKARETTIEPWELVSV